MSSMVIPTKAHFTGIHECNVITLGGIKKCIYMYVIWGNE